MKALVYKGPQTLEYCDFADPEPQGDEQLVKVESVGICGSDMHAYLGHDERRPAPLILGHEVAGVSGQGGMRVTINPLVTCGLCRSCVQGRDNLCTSRQIISMPPREGGFAEMLAIPLENLVEVPDSITDDQAALAEPIACGWHAVRLARSVSVEPANALVIGGGAIGVGSALSLVAQGIESVCIVEPSTARRDYLQSVCGLEALDPAGLGEAEQHDIVIDAVGIEVTRAQASKSAAPGGVIVHIGLGSPAGGLDMRRMTLHEITLIGTYTYTAQDFRETAQAMFDGRLGALDWTETRPLSEGARAFFDIREGRVAAPKIILKP